MDLKVMELLAKIYQTQTEMRSEFRELGTEFKELGTEFKGLGTEFKGLRTEFKGLRNEFKELKTEFNELRADQETIAKNVAKIITVVEHDIPQKIGAIFDFRDMQIDHNQKTSQALERIEAKVEVLQLETSNLRRIK